MTTQDPELSAALGWPGGISDPALDRVQLLQMVAALRLASQQALEALLTYEQYIQPLTNYFGGPRVPKEGSASAKVDAAITALRAALAQGQVEPDISRCPQCNGPADNGFDRSFPPSPYLCTQCMAEPGAWVASPDGRAIYDDTSADDGLLRVSGDFANDEQRLRYAQRIVDALNAALSKAEPAQKPVAWRYKPMIGSPWSLSDDGYYISCKRDKGYAVEPLYTAPPRRTMVPLTEEEIDSLPWNGSPRQFARAVEKSSWEKNHG